MQARHTRVRIVYNKEDISEQIAPFLDSFDFKDSADSIADDMTLSLEDRKELWESDWFPDKGATLKASLIFTNWSTEGYVEIPIGIFEVDEIEVSGLPHKVKIKAVSVPSNNELRGTKKNRAWEKVKLSAIAKEIADRAGIGLYLNMRDDEEIERLEQKDESDLAFLTRVAKEKGYGVKLSDSQLDVYYIPDLDNLDPVLTIKKAATKIKSYSFRSKTRDIYKACHVKYENAKKGETIEYTFEDANKEDGQILEVHKEVADVAEAEKLAKGELREKNKDEVTGRIALTGAVSNSMLMAGLTVQVEDFHKFDGKYLITSTSHSVSSSGYSCNIDMRRCLNGY